MTIHDEFSGTITLTENSSRELFKVLKEQDEAFINDMLDGRCGFTLKSADGRSVELVPNTNKRCQCVENIGSVGADRKTEPQTHDLRTDTHECVKDTHDKDEPQTSCKTCRFGEVDEGYVRCAYYSKATKQTEPQPEDKCKGCIYENDRSLMACVSCQGKVPYDGYDFEDDPQTERG